MIQFVTSCTRHHKDDVLHTNKNCVLTDLAQQHPHTTTSCTKTTLHAHACMLQQHLASARLLTCACRNKQTETHVATTRIERLHHHHTQRLSHMKLAHSTTLHSADLMLYTRLLKFSLSTTPRQANKVFATAAHVAIPKININSCCTAQ